MFENGNIDKENLNSNLQNLKDNNYKNNNEENLKTELCKKWIQNNGFCPYGIKCKFAHGKIELVEKNSKNYKKKECHSFYSKGYCNYGTRCLFKHDERKIREILRTDYFNILLNSKKNIENYQNIFIKKDIDRTIKFQNNSNRLSSFKKLLLDKKLVSNEKKIGLLNYLGNSQEIFSNM